MTLRADLETHTDGWLALYVISTATPPYCINIFQCTEMPAVDRNSVGLRERDRNPDPGEGIHLLQPQIHCKPKYVIMKPI